MPDQKPRDRLQRRLGAMKTERESFDSHYTSLAQFVSPRRGRFLKQQRNKGSRHFWNEIINSQATWALRIATAGLFNGIMSPSRPWLLLETDDPDRTKFKPSQEFFFQVQEQMRRVFNSSNLYNMAPMMLREQILMGTGCMFDEDDPFTLSRYYTNTVGSYYLAQNDRYVVDTVAREFELTVEQLVGKFSNGREINPNISPMVRNLYDRGTYDTWVPVVHFVEPNAQVRLGSRRPTEKPYSSVYYEPGNNDRDVFLREKGFEEFPFYCPRWETTNEDIYGTDCPGMTVLGDVRQLQHQEKRKGQALDKHVSPPLHGPASLRNQAVSSLPAGGTFYDAPGTQNTLRPIYEVQPNLQDMSQDIERVEQRISRGFLVDLFLAISDMEGVQPRNQLELSQRNAERLQQMGPTLEREFGEFLDPLVSRTFNKLARRGLLPPVPEALQDQPLKPRYISTLAMAQQAVSTGNIDRLAAFTAGLIESGLSDGKKFDGDGAIDRYATLIGAPPELIVPDEVVQQQRAAEQEQEQAAQGVATAEQLANAARTAGEINLSEDNVASRLVGG